MTRGFWDLHDKVEELDAAGSAWGTVAQALETASDRVVDRSRDTLAGWEGESAESFDAHRRALVTDLDRASSLAGTVASTLLNAAGSVRIAQGRLDQSWASVATIPATAGPYGSLLFRTEDDEERARVRAADAEATDIRRQLDGELAADEAAVTATLAEWRAVAGRWLDVATGRRDGFRVPAEGGEVGVVTFGDQTLISAGSGDDTITVTVDPDSGAQLVTVNGTTYVLPADTHLVIRGGGGNDTITVPAGTHVGFTIIGSAGDDQIRGGAGDDTILALDGKDDVDLGGGADYGSGGQGADYLDGGTGDDTLSGGLDNDSLYGLDGDDLLGGGEAQDFLEGGRGEDTLLGGDGPDVLSGGLDDDRVFGGAGDDVSYGGRGTDLVIGGLGSDLLYDDPSVLGTDNERRVTIEIPDTTYFFRIEGSPEFVARVEADLELLRASPGGQQMLENLQDRYDDSGFLGFNKATLTIREYANPADPDNSTASHSGNDATINYNTRLHDFRDAPPVVVLYHELAHVYDYLNDTFVSDPYAGDDTVDHGIKTGERQASGLPIDHDSDAATPERIDPDHPFVFTENGLRDEMGLPGRDHYR